MDSTTDILAAFACIRVQLARVIAMRRTATFTIMEQIMAVEKDLTAAEAALTQAVTDAEARVVALDTANTTTVDALKAQVATLTAQVAAGITPAQIDAHVAALNAIIANVAKIDPDTVSPKPVASLSVTPASLAIAVGGTGALAVTALDASGAAVSPQPAAAFTSSDPTVATVDASGTVSGVAAGKETVTVSIGTITRDVPVVVA